jgi:hypothetical protein
MAQEEPVVSAPANETANVTNATGITMAQEEPVVSAPANETANVTNATGITMAQEEPVVSAPANETANATETASNETGNPILDALKNIFGGITGDN